MDNKNTINNLVIANRELAFQKDEKGKRAEELVIANIELAFQTKEKGKRAAELIIANKELAFQTKEKGKRADELVIADKELAFQTEEKEKRADELVIANKELAFQTKEKGKRADELIIANKELAFQNKEKGKRADELISYKHFFYNSLDLACFVTPDGYFEELNKSFTKTLGYTTKELTEKKLVDFLHPDDVKPTIKGLEYLALGLGSLSTINRYRTLAGTYRHIEWNSVYNHETRKIYATGRDITEKMLASEELVYQNEEKENRAAELVIANKELSYQNDEKENRAAELVIANKELAFQNQEKENRAAELIIANKELAFQNQEKENRAAELVIANKELSYQNEEKENRAAELVIANKELAFQNEEKESRAKELVIANKELSYQNEEKENRAAELVIANKELAFQNEEKENRAAELAIANNELSYQNEEKENRAKELVIANKELSFQNEEKENRAKELVIANKELAFQNTEKENRAGELAIANKELAFQNSEKEKRAGELSIANSELKKAEAEIRKFNEELEQKVIERTAQLEAVNKELESFSYSVSHDLRAPIRAINGYAKILEEDYAGKFDLDGVSALHSITHNSRKMGQLIDDLLAFSKLGRKQVTVSDLNMTALVKSIKDELLIEDRENKTEFMVNVLPPAKGDQALIKQVWINLLSNAIKYSKYKFISKIEIGAYEKDNLVIYYVKDNGAGFDMQYYDKLFGVFQRLHSHEEFEGTGIGLAIVQRIVQRHGGAVWAESKLNEETIFYFSLPGINS